MSASNALTPEFQRVRRWMGEAVHLYFEPAFWMIRSIRRVIARSHGHSANLDPERLGTAEFGQFQRSIEVEYLTDAEIACLRSLDRKPGSSEILLEGDELRHLATLGFVKVTRGRGKKTGADFHSKVQISEAGRRYLATVNHET